MWGTRPFKRLLIFEAPRAQGTGGQFGALAEEHLEPAPKVSRDRLSVPRDVIPSAAVAAPARKVLAGAVRILPPPARPSLPGPPIPEPPDLPLGLGPPRALAAPPRRRRPPARPPARLLVHLHQASQQASPAPRP